MVFDIAKARNDTPACEEIIHFNNAGSSLPPNIVTEKVIDYIQQESVVGGYELAASKEEEINATYVSIAKLIGAKKEEIGRETNATRAWQLPFYAINFEKGDQILTTTSEYCSNFVSFLHLKQKINVDIFIVPNDEFGQLDVNALEDMVNEKVKLVSINHIPTNSGLINPAEEIGKITSENNILYQLDACQSVGQMPIAVEKIKCDILSATGRKYLRGPRGTGFLYVKEKVIEELNPPMLDSYAAKWTDPNEFEMFNTAKRFETFEYSVGNYLGLGSAVNYALDWGLENIWKRIEILASYLREKLGELPFVNLYDIGKRKCGIISFDIQNKKSIEIRNELHKYKINVSPINPANSLIDSLDRNLHMNLRASIHYYNTKEEIDRFCEVLKEIGN